MALEKLYRALLLVYPGEHRREYGEPMVQLFRDRMRRDGGGVRSLVVWLQMIFDLVQSAFKEHKEETVMGSAMMKGTAIRSGGFLLRSLIGAMVIYLLVTVAVMTAGLVSLLTGSGIPLPSNPALSGSWATPWSSTTARTSICLSSPT